MVLAYLKHRVSLGEFGFSLNAVAISLSLLRMCSTNLSRFLFAREIRSGFVAVYASPIPTNREALWSHLGNLRSSVLGPWMLIGDFNEILLPSEVLGGNFSSGRADKFAGMLEKCGMIDLGATGNAFKWFRWAIGSHPISKRLDRVMSDSDWRNCFSEAYVENLCRLKSDHCPLLLRLKATGLGRGDRPFRFQAAWFSHKDFLPFVRDAWSDGNHVIISSLNRVREEAIIFNSRVFSNIIQKKHSLEARLKGI